MNQSASERPGFTVDSRDLLRQLAAAFRQKQSFQVEYEQQIDVELNGMKNLVKSQAMIAFERPNRIAIRQQNSELGNDIVCDGEQLSISIAPLKQYLQSPAPKSIDQLIANPMMMMSGLGGRGPLLELFSSDPYQALMQGVTNSTYVGRDKIGDVEAQRLRFMQPQVDWDLWIAADGSARVLQAQFDMAKTLDAGNLPGVQGNGSKMIVTQQYKNWQFDVQPSGNTFAFHPPEGAKKVDNLYGIGAGGETPQTSQLVGKPAPDIENELLDGGHFSLKELKDKKIVILDFWATWCGPCIEEMPLIAKVADEYRDKGVSLYCINQQEQAKKIRDFLKKTTLNVTVSLDSDGDAGAAYGAESIPLLVLIDKAGIVQSVHDGFSPDIADQLKEELDSVLAGEMAKTK